MERFYVAKKINIAIFWTWIAGGTLINSNLWNRRKQLKKEKMLLNVFALQTLLKKYTPLNKKRCFNRLKTKSKRMLVCTDDVDRLQNEHHL
jgi:hypothetical protein